MTRYSQPAPARKNDGEVPVQRRRAATGMPEGRLALTEVEGNSRLFLYMIGHYLHRLEEERRSLYFGDFDLARVAEIVGMAAIEPGMRDAAFRARYSSLDSIVGLDGQRGVNATSIASALGMPRETVRRKLRGLLRLGFIVEKGRASYVWAPGMLQAPERQAAIARGLHQTVQFMNECLERGVVQWVPRNKGRRK